MMGFWLAIAVILLVTTIAYSVCLSIQFFIVSMKLSKHNESNLWKRLAKTTLYRKIESVFKNKTE